MSFASVLLTLLALALHCVATGAAMKFVHTRGKAPANLWATSLCAGIVSAFLAGHLA
jgi:hypothetical protein